MDRPQGDYKKPLSFKRAALYGLALGIAVMLLDAGFWQEGIKQPTHILLADIAGRQVPAVLLFVGIAALINSKRRPAR